jgi:tetratricopeptide (TPR) repeat protein
MRSLFFVLVVFVFSASAQTPFIKRIYDKATVAAQSAQFESAIADYQKILLFAETEKQTDDFLARVHYNIGICFYHQRQTIDAINQFNEAIKSSRRNYQKAFYALGMAETQLKNWARAETAFRAAIELKKTDGEAWFDLALTYLATKNFDAAETAFANSIKYKSIAAADAHNNLGVIFALRHNFLFAEKEFETALDQSNGKSVEARNNLGFCKSLKLNYSPEILAKLEFSRKNQGE